MKSITIVGQLCVALIILTSCSDSDSEPIDWDILCPYSASWSSDCMSEILYANMPMPEETLNGLKKVSYDETLAYCRQQQTEPCGTEYAEMTTCLLLIYLSPYYKGYSCAASLCASGLTVKDLDPVVPTIELCDLEFSEFKDYCAEELGVWIACLDENPSEIDGDSDPTE